MNTRPEQETFEDVLDAYLAAAPEPTAAVLAGWIRRYPQYGNELTNFTVSRSLMARLPAAEAEPIDEAWLVTRGMSVVRDALRREREREGRAADDPPPASLLAEGARRGLALGDLADLTGLSVPLWRKLDRRLIQSTSIPAPVVEAVARAIGRPVDAVHRYLSLPPTFAAAAQHRAAAAPALAEPEEFFEAVRRDVTLADDRRARLLALQPADRSVSQDPAP